MPSLWVLVRPKNLRFLHLNFNLCFAAILFPRQHGHGLYLSWGGIDCGLGWGLCSWGFGWVELDRGVLKIWMKPICFSLFIVIPGANYWKHWFEFAKTIFCIAILLYYHVYKSKLNHKLTVNMICNTYVYLCSCIYIHRWSSQPWEQWPHPQAGNTAAAGSSTGRHSSSKPAKRGTTLNYWCFRARRTSGSFPSPQRPAAMWTNRPIQTRCASHTVWHMTNFPQFIVMLTIALMKSWKLSFNLI